MGGAGVPFVCCGRLPEQWCVAARGQTKPCAGVCALQQQTTYVDCCLWEWLQQVARVHQGEPRQSGCGLPVKEAV